MTAVNDFIENTDIVRFLADIATPHKFGATPLQNQHFHQKSFFSPHKITTQ